MEYRFKRFETPMDYLQDILDNIPHAKRTKNIHIIEVLTNNKELQNANKEHMNKVKQIIVKLDTDIKAIYMDFKRNRSEDMDKIKVLKSDAVEEIEKIDLNIDSILGIFNSLYGAINDEHDVKKCKLLLLSILWKAKYDLVTQSFKYSSDGSIKKLVPNDNGELLIWGINYIIK